jgi:ATP synthase protein I
MPAFGGGDGPPNDPVPGAAALTGMGVQFLAAILLCLFAGRWLDGRLGTAPWLMVLGVLAGAGASTVAMYRRVFPRGGGPASK